MEIFKIIASLEKSPPPPPLWSSSLSFIHSLPSQSRVWSSKTDQWQLKLWRWGYWHWHNYVIIFSATVAGLWFAEIQKFCFMAMWHNDFFSLFPILGLHVTLSGVYGIAIGFLLPVYSQGRSSIPPQDPINEIYYSKVESLGTCRFQIHRCILACVMSREFTREAVRKFEPTQFPRIWRKCLLRNFIHSKIFNLSKYREVLMTYSLLITHAEMPNWTWHQLQERL